MQELSGFKIYIGVRISRAARERRGYCVLQVRMAALGALAREAHLRLARAIRIDDSRLWRLGNDRRRLQLERTRS